MPSSPPRSPSPPHSGEAQVCHVGYSPSGAQIVGVLSDASLSIFDSSGRCVLSGVKGHEMAGSIDYVSFIAEFIILTTSADCTHQDIVLAAAALPDEHTIASVSRDGMVMLWDMDTLEVDKKFEIGDTHTHPLLFSPDGTRLVGVRGGTVYAWDVEAGEMIITVTLTMPRAVSATFSYDGSQVVFGCGDDFLRCWDVESGEIVGEPYKGHGEVPDDIVCSPDGKLVASAAALDIHIWNVKEHKIVAKLEGRGSLAISPDSRYLVHPGHLHSIVVTDLSSIIESHSSFLDLPAIRFPQSTGLNARGGQGGSTDPRFFLDFAATSRPSGSRTVVGGERGRRESLTLEVETKAGGRLSRIWRKLSRARSLGNRERRRANSQEEERQARRLSVAAARDKNPVAIAPAPPQRTQKRKPEQSTREQPVEVPQTPLSRSETSTSGSERDSRAEEDQNEESESHGCCHACCVWMCFKMPLC
ncbi:WD40 repeat-like protein [Paxillus ammoniavirescens]|nr:WD40 repeat-like protein [Paxillus ammoniavirescens]